MRPPKSLFANKLTLGFLAVALSGCASLPAPVEPEAAEAAPEATPAVSVAVVTPPRADPVPPKPTLSPFAHTVPEPAGLCDRESHRVAEREIEWDVWERIRGGMTLPASSHPRVQIEREWFARNQRFLDRVVERATPYLHHIVQEVERRGMPTEIALLPIVESAFQPFAYSHGRASGIWQFIPSTGRLYGLDQNWWYDGRRDIVESTRAALDFLADLNRMFDGDWMLALAAYNSGGGTVRRAITRNRAQGKPTDFFSLQLPIETRGYVPRLLAIAELVAEPERHGVVWAPIADQPYFAQVDAGSQIDLAMAADLAGIELSELYRLNPAFNQWATDPDGEHKLLVPVENVESFRERIADLPKSQRVQWKRHRVRAGDNLLALADRYGTSVDVIRRANHIRGNMIRAGDHLLIPTASKALAAYALSANQRLKALQEVDRGGRKVLYTVRTGDTFWDLSRRFEVGVRGLAKWNGMAPTDPLAVGQQLVVWLPVELARSLEPDDGMERVGLRGNNGSVTVRSILYKVRRGDSLARISEKFGVSIDDVRRWNSLSENERLKPGQRINLRIDVTRQADPA